MNSFNSFESIFGEANAECINQTFREFLEQSCLIRNKLGAQSYLFDNYLDLLLSATTAELTRNAAERGFAGKPPIARICAEIVENKPRGTQNPLYDQFKKYIDEYPLPFQENFTQTEFYCVMLSGAILNQAMKLYQEELGDLMYEVADNLIEIRHLYKRICELLGSETEMEKLNELFRRRFLIAPPMTVFVQGFTNQIMLSLLHRDPETSKRLFQLIFDSGLEVPKE